MEPEAILVIVAGLAAVALVGQKIQGSMLTGPMLITAYGLLVGASGFGLLEMELSNSAVRLLAEATLILVLFTDAADIDLRQLRSDHDLPVRLLALGMPLSIILGAVIAGLMFDVLTAWEALLLAAILVPTDAALGQAVVSNRAVPLRIRLGLNVESGLNDGIALPVILVLASCASAAAAIETNDTNWLSFAFTQVTLGPLAGVAIGYGGARLIALSQRAGWMTEAGEGIAGLALAFGSFAAAEMVHGNGFIAAFVAGLTFANTLKTRCEFLREFAETEGRMLTLATFLVVGASMAPQALPHFDAGYVVFGVLALTVMRMIPVGIAVSGTGVSPATTVFLGWFGPRGLASALFLLLIVEDFMIPHRDVVFTAVLITILMSVLLHGLTAGPAAVRYGSYTQVKGECAENRPVSPRPFMSEADI